LLNSDVETPEGWIEPLVEYMEEHPEVVACQPKILSYTEKEKFEHAGAAGGFVDNYGFPYCRGRIFSEVEEDRGQYDEVTQVFWATGAALFIRRKEYLSVGGLDATFFAHMEEIDFCWRLNSRGKKLVCVPQSHVFHLGGGTLNTSSPRKTYLNFRNNLLMIFKNETEDRLSKVLFMRKILDNVAALMFLLKGEKENFKAVRKARKEFKKVKLEYQHKREENLKEQIICEYPYNYKKSIVFAFYALQKRYFHQL
jgi:GT2 family glycosyltransferase